MSVVYIQLRNGLKKISDEEYSPTKNDVVEALGYTPVDPANMPDISNSENDVLYVTDNEGYVIAKIDKDGIHTTEVKAGGIKLAEVLSQHTENEDVHVTAEDKTNWNGHIEDEDVHVTPEDKARWDDNTAASEESVSQHVNDTDIHVSETEKATWNAKSNFNGQYNSLKGAPSITEEQDDALYIVDDEGYVIAMVNKDGLDITALKVGGAHLSDTISALMADHAANEDIHLTDTDRTNVNKITTLIKDLDTVEETVSSHTNQISIISETANDAFLSASAAVTAVDTHSKKTDNPHAVTKDQVRLGNVDNTSDMDKPVSTQQQEALDAHTTRTDNPHGVTMKQLGVDTALSNLEKQLSEQIVSESDEWHIVDDQGNVVATIDAEGVHTIKVWLNGQDVMDIIDDKIADNNTEWISHTTDDEIHVTKNDKSTWNECCDTVDLLLNDGSPGLTYDNVPLKSGEMVTTSRKKCIGMSFISTTDIYIASHIDGRPVTEIDDRAFYERSTLTSMNIPNTVTSIGVMAFYKCTGLKSVVIPDSVVTIGGEAFSGCSGLTHVTIPDGVTSLGERAFEDCTSLKTVEIPSGIPFINEYTFNRCTSLIAIFYKGTCGDFSMFDFCGSTSMSNLYSSFRVYCTDGWIDKDGNITTYYPDYDHRVSATVTIEGVDLPIQFNFVDEDSTQWFSNYDELQDWLHGRHYWSTASTETFLPVMAVGSDSDKVIVLLGLNASTGSGSNKIYASCLMAEGSAGAYEYNILEVTSVTIDKYLIY